MASAEAVDGQIAAARLSVKDFELGDVLGEGSYAQVIEARHRKTGDQYALKVVDKSHVLRQNKQKYVMSEKKILSSLDHPGIIRLFATFQDNASLHFLLELAPGGELLKHLKSLGQCLESHIKFYCAEILLILEYLHDQNVIHRDLKPENLLLKDGHIKLVDFGSAKQIDGGSDGDRKRRDSFVGTAEYIAPELLDNEPVGFEADLWAFGCVIYRILVGSTPFKGASEYLTFQNIMNFQIEYPAHLSADAKSLIQRLLSRDPKERIGSGFESLKSHPFFDGIVFDGLFAQQMPPLQSRLEDK